MTLPPRPRPPRQTLSTRWKAARLAAVLLVALAFGLLSEVLAFLAGGVIGGWIATDLATDRAHLAHARGYELGLEHGGETLGGARG